MLRSMGRYSDTHSVDFAFFYVLTRDKSFMQVTSKLPQVGTTIFSVMSQLADVYGAVNLGQGFPDFPVPLRLQEALAGAVREDTISIRR